MPGEADADGDGDGLTTLEEQTYGTNPAVPDIDGSGRTDGEEVSEDGTNPLNMLDNVGQATAGSCADSCGGLSKAGTCWCDTACRTLGDCCHDYQATCCFTYSTALGGGTFLYCP